MTWMNEPGITFTEQQKGMIQGFVEKLKRIRRNRIFLTITAFFIVINMVFWSWFGVIKFLIWMIRKYS